MSLSEVTQSILDLVEKASGRPVVVTEDRSLRTMASVRMARGSAPAHVVVYNPDLAATPNYLIAYQCGFILRLFSVSLGERHDLAATPGGRNTVHRLLSSPSFRKKLPPQQNLWVR